MTIVVLKKATICGSLNDKAAVLEGLQHLGCLHLVSLRPPPTVPEKAATERPEDAYTVLKYLSDFPQRRRQVPHAENFAIDTVVREALENKQRTRDVSDRRDFIEERVKQLAPWGDFSWPAETDIAGLKLWFYSVPNNKLKSLPSDDDLVWQTVHRDNRQAWVVVVSADEPPPDAMPVPRTHTGALSLTELTRQLEDAESQLEELRARRWAMTRWIFLIRRDLAGAENAAALVHAFEQTDDGGGVFAVQGWVPAKRVDELHEFIDARGLALLIADPEPADTPPTLLENPPQLVAGEDLVGFYQTPGYRGWDPSSVVYFSFMLFSGMILSDVGYAAILTLVIAYFWRPMGHMPRGRYFRSLVAGCIAVAGVCGVLHGSYFGLSPTADSFLGRLQVLDFNDFPSAMRLSVTVGVLHIALANGIAAWHTRHRIIAWSSVGWIAVASGGLFIWLGQGDPGGLASSGVWLLGGGVFAVFAFGSDRAFNGPADLFWRMLDGILALTRLSQMLGDTLSYLRLFALGLATASLAMTVNGLARDAAEGEAGMGLLFSLLILILGHLLNFVLTLMSAVVHGLRLNFIEFYNWGGVGQGAAFRAFAKREISP